MRHRIDKRKFSRPTEHRMAMLRNMAIDIINYGGITTTQAKAKDVRSVVEKLITLGKNNNLHARQQALAFIGNKDVTKKVFDEIAPQYMGRNGGYTRIVKLGCRRGDAAPIARIELVK